MPDLFETLGAVVRDHKAGLAHVGELLGLAFERSQTGSNDWIEVAKAGNSKIFDEVTSAEIRIDRHSKKIRLVVLSVDKQSRCVPEREIIRRFGASPELSVPAPPQPADAPVYYVYHYPWGDLRIAISSAGEQCVETVVTEFND